jgi:transcriptional regulator with XRE-family HTH domain
LASIKQVNSDGVAVRQSAPAGDVARARPNAAGGAGRAFAGAAARSRPPVGRELRRWRRSRNLTLARVAAASGLNIGYLSQIENEKAVPSLDALMAIAAALDIPAAWLLLDSTPPPRVVRASERPSIAPDDRAGGSAMGATEVDAGTSRDLRIIEAVVAPGARTGVHAHLGDEHHVVITGRWRMTQGDHVIELGPGDYLAWDPAVPHDVENIGTDVGRMLVIYPRHGRRTE